MREWPYSSFHRFVRLRYYPAEGTALKTLETLSVNHDGYRCAQPYYLLSVKRVPRLRLGCHPRQALVEDHQLGLKTACQPKIAGVIGGESSLLCQLDRFGKLDFGVGNIETREKPVGGKQRLPVLGTMQLLQVHAGNFKGQEARCDELRRAQPRR